MKELDRRSEEWMRALAAGDESAFRPLVEAWQEPLLRFVFRYLQNEADARDLVQETLLRVYARRASFRPGARFSSWVFTIAANLARNFLRWRWLRRSESLELAEQTQLLPHSDPAPDFAVERDERIAAVQRALAALPHDLRVTLLLHEYEGLGYAEIAPVVGCGVRGVESRLARARERLRHSLSAYLGDGTKPGRPLEGLPPAPDVAASPVVPPLT